MSEPMSLKLLIDTKGKKVLSAEAGKDFVDFLFQILALPLGTTISLLREQTTGGSLAKLYESLQDLDNSYILSTKSKDIFLKPAHPVLNSTLPLLAAPPTTTSTSTSTSWPRMIFVCSCYRYYSDDPAVFCPSCYRVMKVSNLSYVGPPAASPVSAGVVRGLVTYMVMDDLVVKPMSTISSITLLNKFNVKDVGALEEKVVHFGVDEAVKLLNATLQSRQVLTDVFLKGIKIKLEPK